MSKSERITTAFDLNVVNKGAIVFYYDELFLKEDFYVLI